MDLAYMNHPARTILDEARWAAENGFDALDLTIEGPAALIDSFDPTELRALLDAAGMRVVGHTAWYLPFASPVERVRRAAVEEVAASLPVFAALGASMVNVHMRAAFRSTAMTMNSSATAPVSPNWRTWRSRMAFRSSWSIRPHAGSA